jgi:hypothetical protein
MGNRSASGYNKNEGNNEDAEVIFLNINQLELIVSGVD